MTLASSSKVQMSYMEEVTYGTTPVTGNSTNLRMTGESLAYDITSKSSDEINSTRQVTDSVQVAANANGGINLELSYREYDPFLESILASTFNTYGTDGVKVVSAATFAVSAKTITGSGTDFQGLVAGQWISVIGAPAAANIGVYLIATVTNTVITVSTLTPLAADLGPVAISVSSTRLSCGVATLRSFSLQKQFSDVTQFFAYKGMTPSKLDLSFDTGSILKGSISFMGKNGVRSDTTIMPGTAAASQSNGIMNSVTGVGSVLLNGAVLAGTYVKSAKVSVDAKLRGQTAIANLGNVGVGTGTFAIGGTLEIYLASGAIYDQALNNTTVSIQFPVYDVAKNGYAFIFNNVKLGVPKINASAKDADVMLSVPFTAIAPNSTTDKMLIIDRFGVVRV